MEENAANYFASMSHLASKMMQYNESVREMYRDTWEGLSWEKQEELIDQHTIDPKIADKYASCRRTSEPVDCFPVLKINSGEKIVVDFEHDDVSLLIILVYLIHNQFVNLCLVLKRDTYSFYKQTLTVNRMFTVLYCVFPFL